MTSLLVTGANGFIGRQLCGSLVEAGHRVKGVVRPGRPLDLPDVERCEVPGLETEPDWRPHLAGVEVLVHCAARVHVLKERSKAPLEEFRAANVAGSRHLAAQAAAAGVRRLVFLSSIGAEAAGTAGASPYQQSKAEAEAALAEECGKSGLELVILRPPLVYGPGAPGNFARLRCIVAAGWPLPLASIRNRRGFLYVGNLASAVALCLTHPAAPGAPLALSDGEDLSTPAFVRLLASALGRRARLIPCPPGLLKAGLAVIGRGDMAKALCESLPIDDRAARERLGWQPVCDTAEGLRRSLTSGGDA